MDKLKELLASQGYECTPAFDGEITRFTRTKYLSGWFEGYQVQGPNGIIYKARFGDWATGEKHEWSSDANTTYSKEEMEFLAKQYAELDKKRAAKKKADQEAAAKMAKTLWEQAKLAQENHPYLVKKKIGRHGVRQLAHELVIPIYFDGELVSLQFIDDKGAKRFLSGGKLKGAVYVLNAVDDMSVEYVAEGFATAASIHEATGKTCIITFNTAGMVAWAEKQGPGTGRFVIAADNDQWTKGNPGLTAARKAESILKSKGYRVEVRSPDFLPEQKGMTDWNDYHVEYGLEATKTSLISDKIPSVVQNEKHFAARKLGDLYSLTIEAMPWKPDAKGKLHPPSQDEVAITLYKIYGEHLIREVEDVFLWTGTHWVELDPKDFKRFIRDRGQVLMSGAASDRDLSAYHNMLLDKMDRVPDGSTFFQQLPNLCNFLDGTLEIIRDKRSGEYRLNFREHREQDLLTWVLPYKYKDPRPTNPVFEQWLERSFKSDPDKDGKIRALSQIGGAALISLFPRISFLYGEGGTGKSTFAKLCMRFMGKGNYSSVEPADQQGFLKETMINKQANIVTDISEARIDPAQWKRVEDRVPELINRKNKRAILGYLPALHIYCGNQLPRGIDGTTSAMDRRITIVEFLNSVVLNDAHTREYEDLILEAGPGAVLDFFERGLVDLIKSGGKYFNPASGKQRLLNWKLQNDLMGLFLKDIGEGLVGSGNSALKFDSKGRVKQSVFNEELKKWVGRPLPNQQKHSLLEDLKARGFRIAGVNGIQYVYGISVPGAENGSDSEAGSGPGF